MSHSHQPSSGGSPESIRAGHELTDVHVMPLLQFGAMLTVVVVLTMWGVKEIHDGLEAYFDERATAAHPMHSAGAAPAGPLLQQNEVREYQAFAAQQASRTTSDSAYAWIDEQEKIVRVPIARAMELVLEEGLPHRKADK